jgi:hypothetical protein
MEAFEKVESIMKLTPIHIQEAMTTYYSPTINHSDNWIKTRVEF